MGNFVPHGLGVALVTPFHQNHTIDFDGLENVLVHVSSSVDYMVVLGTTAETATLSQKEKAEILAFVKSRQPEIPIVYGLGGNNTMALVDEVQSIDFDGIAAILSSSPAYNKPSQRGIIEHYTQLADSSPVPVILYNVPGRTGSNLSAHTTLTLARHPNIIGTKEASGDLEQCMKIMAGAPDNFYLISGDDLLTVPLMSIGAVGLISVMSNAYPAIFKDMISCYNKGDMANVRQNLFSILELNSLMYEEGNPVGVKQLLDELGLCENHVRLPLMAASDDLASRIRSATF